MFIFVSACGSSAPEPGGGSATGGGSAAGGAGGGSGVGGLGGGASLLDCSAGGGTGNSSYTTAFANPVDFSINSETQTLDQHTFRISLADWATRVTSYTTGGTADHQHAIAFPAESLDALATWKLPIVATTGPPLNAVGAHTHTVMVHDCGVPGG